MADTETKRPVIYTTGDTRANLTGSWRFMRPLFADKAAPCMAACPAGNSISRFMGHAARGEFQAALETIKKENPLPSVCGRVCPHPCMISCSRGSFDTPIPILEVERFIGDFSDRVGLCLPEKAKATGKKVAVIGSGPGGLACAYHCALAGHSVTIFESADKPGGVLRYGIPAYRLPDGPLDRDLGFISELGIELKTNTKISVDDFKKINDEYDALCVAVGAHRSHRLGIPGEDSDSVMAGLAFLKKINAGEKPDPGKKVFVIGGGNTAMDAARSAVRLGADVTVVYRRERKDMPAFDDEIIEAMEEGVKFDFLVTPVKIEESGGGLAITFMKMKPGEPDDSGRARPVPIEGSEFTATADTMLTAIGESTEIDFEDYIEPDQRGQYPLTSDWTTTLNLKTFICGDAGPNDRTVAHALGSGKRAAIAIDVLLRGRDFDQVKEAIAWGPVNTASASAYTSGNSGYRRVVEMEEINTAHFDRRPGTKRRSADPGKRINCFEEVNLTAGEADALVDAGRCFSCGTCNECGKCLLFCPDMAVIMDAKAGKPDFNADYCKGCGICAFECPRGVIEMVEEDK